MNIIQKYTLKNKLSLNYITNIARILLRSSKRKKYTQNYHPVLIAGTGRSGTHFLAETIGSHPDFDDLTGGKENPYVFYDVLKEASQKKPSTSIRQKIFKKYIRLMQSTDKRLVDQSHPILWLTEDLFQHIPDARVIYILRNPYSVAYSTLNHAGVSRWLKQAEDFSHPNQFLGTTYIPFENYKQLTEVEKSTARWFSHFRQAFKLRKAYPEKFYIIYYEDLCLNPETELEKIGKFLMTNESKFSIQVSQTPLNKKDRLSNHERQKINQILKSFCENSKLSESETLYIQKNSDLGL